MKTKVWVETPFGSFNLVRTNELKGCSCSQCAMSENIDCDLMCCEFDTEYTHYHFERRK